MKVVVTGGHLTPAMAVITKLRKLKPTCQIYFLGRKIAVEGDKATSFEYLEVKSSRIPFFEISTGRFQRKFTRYSFISLAKFLPGLTKSLTVLKKLQPDIILTFGGYIALPVAIAAFFLRIPVIAHEQSTKLGLTNKVVYKFARLMGVSDKTLVKKLSNSKVIYTGPLLREEIFKTRPKSARLSKFLQKLGKGKVIYITGGATGSHFLNQLTQGLIPQVLKENFVIHQTGNLRQSYDFKRLTNFKQSLATHLAERYFLTEFITSQNLGAVLSKADLVICRSGANTTSELTALGKVAIIIPLEWGEEQKAIAKTLSQTGAVIIIPQDEAVPNKVLQAIKDVFANLDEFKENAKSWQKDTELDGALIFAKKILSFNA